MLKFLGVSRSGYRAFLNRKVSPSRQRKDAVKKEIQKIYDNSKQNYGAPKITKELRKSGESIAQRTVGKYMREMGIKAQWIKPWITTTKDSDFSDKLHNILNEQFNPELIPVSFLFSIPAQIISCRRFFNTLILIVMKGH